MTTTYFETEDGLSIKGDSKELSSLIDAGIKGIFVDYPTLKETGFKPKQTLQFKAFYIRESKASTP